MSESTIPEASKIDLVRSFYKRNERWVPLVFFTAGFLFDVYMLRRIDDYRTILQQAGYLLVSGGLISFDLLEELGMFHPKSWFKPIWRYREAVIHFMLGTLMNGYTIFYFKSASVFTSLVFIVLLVVILTVVEFKKFGGAQRAVHFALLSICSISYFIYVVPIVLGFVGVVPFIGALIASFVVLFGLFHFLKKRLGVESYRLRNQLVIPAILIHAFFVVLYFTELIPPVPLSLSFSGIYHDVKKSDGSYQLTYLKDSHHWWQHGDQTFLARAGDKIFCFVQVFCPTRFHDKLQIRWIFHDKKRGWEKRDLIPFAIEGGREEGYRGYTSKSNYEPGKWRVQIETTDNREIGRIYFTVEPDTTTDERQTIDVAK